MGWIFGQQYVRENLKLGPGGEVGPVNDLLRNIRNTTERIGANIMGKRMFEGGERGGIEVPAATVPSVQFLLDGPLLEHRW